MASIINITDAAAKQIKTILESEYDKKALRISIEGGGCSGFSYKFELESNKCEDDVVFEKNGSQIFIDKISLSYIANSEIDFVDTLLSKSFQIRNPNAISSCGCGTSFSM
ncbi:iron-sulfur cluster insertion protein ErpA [Candidatus Liberibacter solanacearum]|uniref:Iron-sulfur cluster insertion protein ErpA n=1 Tax=Candidatus Liberibacter solanacearum TaxID=556287 RepID=A0A3R7R8Y8_9HYPH|nr:iron-sulfur cluster insertion protein ErpA [Candidatus Liberibacter solanacearum]RPD36865.1 iron-sulfur cluster insertion protein ErpA [Candidatus Liberibacter solanacearum]